jgi:hypothetical protein
MGHLAPAAGAPQPSTDGDWQRRREELCAFYEQHEPSKSLCDALALFEKYGRMPFSEIEAQA